MATENAFSPDYSIHPGELLAELIEAQRIEQVELALRLDISPKHLSNIVNEKAGITAKTAIALECVFPDRPARYWLSLQSAHDEFIAREDACRQFSEGESRSWLAHFDLAAYEGAGCIPPIDPDAGTWERTLALLKFFGCSSIDAWKRVYGEVPVGKLRHWDERGSLSLGWMRKGQVSAMERAQALPRFERRAFGRSLRRAKNLSRNAGGDVAGELQRECANAGVLLMVEEPLPGMHARSASYWMRNTPVVQLRADALTNDELWLDFAREAAEVLHGKTYVMSLSDDDWAIEPYADEDGWLVSWERSLAFASEGDYSREAVIRFAEEEGVHPGIVVGMLQRQGLVRNDSPLNALKTCVEYSIESF
ncbi:HigA family addiction module antitoxin [Eggerthella sinensis]|uniref:HigA family addiction module antitoxin n=1 Tax=Eggerthella sinensis TaxID=242230 RepID=UPI0022E26021|nr:HigA family addiction module antitoxin [Eggerthella sinensis]